MTPKLKALVFSVIYVVIALLIMIFGDLDNMRTSHAFWACIIMANIPTLTNKEE